MNKKRTYQKLNSKMANIFCMFFYKHYNATNYLETTAEYDYRTFQPRKVTDPNDNISVFDFSPLGLLKATALIGKGTEGDYKAASGTFYERYAPSVVLEYDFFAFIDHEQPIWVKTIQREKHYQQEPDSPTITKVEYSDGFGRLLQTRAQAEDVIFGNKTFGSSGLSPNQNGGNSPAVGVEREATDPINVVVSGWKRYNNKGEVVEEYEPFFDKGFDYTLPNSDSNVPQQGVKIKMFYDPLGRVVKTVNPDNSEERVIFGIPEALDKIAPYQIIPTPWETYHYDQNDLCLETGSIAYSGDYTPKSELIDAMGRTIQTTDHKSQPTADPNEYEDVVMKYRYDIRGNLLEVRDPYNRKVSEQVYDFANQALKSIHIDSGKSTVLLDALGKMIESEDAKEARTLSAFGIMNRPIYSWAKDNSLDSFTVRHAIIYGDDVNHGPVNPKTTNHLGQVYKNYDESGLDEILEYDFKGNVIATTKQVIKDSLLLDAINAGALNNWEITPYVVNWTATPWNEETNLLEGNYQTNVVFDALNRPTETTYPADINNNRKIATTQYNRAGALEKVSFDGTDYINHIAYNAKGDTILTAYGNGIMTRQLFDNKTFLLKRTRTSSYIQTGWTFEDNAGVKEDKVFDYDLMGNIVQTHDKCTDCGLTATPDQLQRNFSYDPLYRLLIATGRESNTQSSSVIWGDPPITQPPNAQNCRTYTQAFEYDKLGNILKKTHTATGNSYTRRYNYQHGSNKLTNIDNNQSVPTIIANFEYDAVGNQIICQTERFYEWDYGNRMKAFYNQASAGTEPSVYAVYLYDGGGNRTKKLVRKQGGNWESVTYISGTFEYHKKDTEEKNYTQVANVEIRTGSFSGDVSDSVLYQLKDNLGSVGLRINHSGTTIDREEYYPFGDSSLRTFSKKRYRYCGKEKDEESGLYYYGARYYMSWVGRFTSCDPLQSEYPNFSTYCYVYNNPINMNDPTGMEGEKASASADNISTDGGGDTTTADGGGGEASSGGEVKQGDTFTDEKGNEHTTSIGEAKVYGEKDSFSSNFNPIIRNSQLNGIKNTGGIKYGEGLGFKPEFTEGLSSLYKPLYGALAIPALPIVTPMLVEGGVSSLSRSLSGVITDFGVQTAANYAFNPQEGLFSAMSNVNATSLLLSGLNPSNSIANITRNSFISSSFEVSYESGVYSVFNGKSFSEVGISVGLSAGLSSSGKLSEKLFSASSKSNEAIYHSLRNSLQSNNLSLDNPALSRLAMLSIGSKFLYKNSFELGKNTGNFGGTYFGNKQK